MSDQSFAAWLYKVAALFLAILAPLASAHQQGSSYSNWQFEAGQLQSVSVRVSALDLTRVGIHPGPQANAQIINYLQRQLTVAGCDAQTAAVATVEPGWYSVAWPWRCDGSEPVITSAIFAAVAPNHLHFARWHSSDGTVVDSVLHRARRSVSLNPGAVPKLPGLAAYLRLGVEHILGGYDHLAFLLGLLMLAARRQLLWLITGFTAGHSITLALASTGWLLPNSGFVEAAIAWSIALLCAEIMWRRYGHTWPWLLPLVLLVLAVGHLPLALLLGLALFTLAYARALKVAQGPARQRLTAAVTVAFGLIHGCGFASVLSGLGDINVRALLGFNLGIELGQLALVLAILPLAWLLKGRLEPVKAAATYSLLALASYWWVLRL